MKDADWKEIGDLVTRAQDDCAEKIRVALKAGDVSDAVSHGEALTKLCDLHNVCASVHNYRTMLCGDPSISTVGDA